LIARKYRLKVLIQLRGSNFNQFVKNNIIKSYVKNVLKSTSGVIVLHKNYKNIFQDYFPINRIFNVTNGVDLNYNFLKKSSKNINILFLSNLLKDKGIISVLDGFIKSFKVRRNITLSLVGVCDDLYIKKKIKLISGKYPIKYFGLADSEEKYKHFKKADIFIFPPIVPEGLPWCVIEALASGLPIIITKNGNGCDLVENNKNGFVVKDVNEISNKITKLAHDTNLRLKMSKSSKQLYDERFTENQMVKEYSEVFKSIINL